LFAVNGAFGGSPQGASGEGVLAFVEFLRLGNGTSDITLDNVDVTTVVPEPGTLALLATGILLSRLRSQKKHVSQERTR
jgi:hypothetical protein